MSTSPERPSGLPERATSSGRMPRGLAALGVAGALATLLMAFAPQVGALDPRTGYDDDILPGTDGTAHYESPETGRRVDVQLVALDPVTTGPVEALAAGREVLAVRLRLAAARSADISGCHVTIEGAAGPVDTRALPVGGSGCDAAAGLGPGPAQVVTTTYVAVPAGTKPRRVRVMWAPPAYVRLPAV